MILIFLTLHIIDTDEKVLRKYYIFNNKHIDSYHSNIYIDSNHGKLMFINYALSDNSIHVKFDICNFLLITYTCSIEQQQIKFYFFPHCSNVPFLAFPSCVNKATVHVVHIEALLHKRNIIFHDLPAKILLNNNKSVFK